MNTFIWGDKVKWTYEHSLNRKSKVLRTKRGIYWGAIRHTRRLKGRMGFEPLGLVKFGGNKRPSKIPLSEIERDLSTEADFMVGGTADTLKPHGHSKP